MQVKLMMEEGTRFQEMIHTNIYPLLGIVEDGGRPLLVYPSVSYGNLKRLSSNNQYFNMNIFLIIFVCFY